MGWHLFLPLTPPRGLLFFCILENMLHYMFVSCYISHVSLSSFLTHVTDARFRDVVHVARCCAPFRDVVRVSQHCQAQKWKLLEHAMLKTKTAALRR